MPRLNFRSLTLLVVLTVCPPGLFAADAPAKFSQLITSRTAETFAAVREYLKSAPADDREAAALWLFRTATDFGWESQVIAEAESYVQNLEANPATALLADQVRILGLAQIGKSEEADQTFQMFQRKLRLRSPNQGSDLAQSLAMQLQLAGDGAAALAAYEKLTGAFFLNAEVKDWSERRTKRLELFGKPSPAVTGQTTAGTDFDLSAWKGKAVLIDFWATNCRPCLEDLPKLRELYAEFHPLGLEIVGISFDEEEAPLLEFLERQRLPWTIVKNDKQTPERFHVELIPCLVLLDRQGNVACTDVRVSHLRGTLRKVLNP
jgi:peroxiredoxin